MLWQWWFLFLPTFPNPPSTMTRAKITQNWSNSRQQPWTLWRMTHEICVWRLTSLPLCLARPAAAKPNCNIFGVKRHWKISNPPLREIWNCCLANQRAYTKLESRVTFHKGAIDVDTSIQNCLKLPGHLETVGSSIREFACLPLAIFCVVGALLPRVFKNIYFALSKYALRAATILDLIFAFFVNV